MDSILIYQAANDLVQNTGTRNIKRIARSCSLDILETPRFKDVLGFLSLHFDKPLILINSHLDSQTKQMVCGYALGHYLEHQILMDLHTLNKSLAITDKEICLYEPNAFASHLMLDSEEVYQMTKRKMNAAQIATAKRIHTLLEVAKKMPNTEFVFIGYGPSADKMKDIPNVKYLGFKTGEELYRIIAEAAISVCPSEWYENCPYSVMESVLLGTPVVGSKMGGIPELIESGKTGELFEAGNVEDLMKAIKKVLQTQDVLERYTKNCSQVNYETTESYYVKLMKIYRGEKNVEQISS